VLGLSTSTKSGDGALFCLARSALALTRCTCSIVCTISSESCKNVHHIRRGWGLGNTAIYLARVAARFNNVDEMKPVKTMHSLHLCSRRRRVVGETY